MFCKNESSIVEAMRVVVFPMTNAVLFPGVTLPLQILEPQASQIFRDIKEQGLLLAVSLAVPQSKRQFSLNAICGAGSVEALGQFGEEGQTDILIHGQKRVRLCSLVQAQPYFIMEAEPLEPDQPVSSGGTQRSFEELRALIKTWVFIHPKISSELSLAFDGFEDFGELTDFFVFHFLNKAREKQEYLNCTHAGYRAEMLAQFLEMDLLRLRGNVVGPSIKRILH